MFAVTSKYNFKMRAYITGSLEANHGTVFNMHKYDM